MKHQSIKVITNILYGIIITITAVLVIETIICFAFRNDKVGSKYRVADPTPQKITSKQDKKDGKVEAFTELEQLRLLTKAPDEDSTGSVYVYGLLAEKGGEKKKFQDLVTAKGIKNGSKITIIGNRAEYKGTAQVGNAYFVSIE